MKSFILPLTLAAVLAGSAAAAPAKRYNVLFIMADDMRWDIGCNTGGGAITPNIDKLAASGVRFTNAFTQFPVCNPSRAALCNSRYPTATGLIANGSHHFRTIHPEFVTLPEYFKKHGYVTGNSGKLFHGKTQDPQSWTEFYKDDVPEGHRVRALTMGGDGQPIELPKGVADEADEEIGEPERAGAELGVRYRVLPNDGDGEVDNWIAANGIELLDKYQKEPFFIAVGFHSPHAPPKAPQRFFDLYRLEDVKLPPDFASKPTAPIGCPEAMLPRKNDVFYMPNDVPPDLAKRVIWATRAATSYADWNVGRVLDELDRLGLAQDTIVVFASDHGYHLGEKGRFGKTTVFDTSLHVPLIIRVPGGKTGAFSTRTVQLIDLYPTLAELCGLPAPGGLQGRSFAELIRHPEAPWDHPALSMARTAGQAIGYTARTEKFRYAEWRGGKDGAVLFDLEKDPLSTRNVADEPRYGAVVQKMKKALQDGFGEMPAQISFPETGNEAVPQATP